MKDEIGMGDPVIPSMMNGEKFEVPPVDDGLGAWLVILFCCALAALLLTGLKLIGVLDWSWGWVLFPAAVPTLIVIVAIAMGVIQTWTDG